MVRVKLRQRGTDREAGREVVLTVNCQHQDNADGSFWDADVRGPFHFQLGICFRSVQDALKLSFEAGKLGAGVKRVFSGRQLWSPEW